MTAAKGPIAGQDITMFAKLKPSSAEVGLKTYITLFPAAGTGGIYGADKANMVGKCDQLGDITKSENSTSFSVFGEDVEESIPGPASLGSIPMGVVLDDANALHKALRDAKIGDQILVVMKKDGTTGNTAGRFVGRVGGTTVSQAPNNVQRLVVTVSLSESPAWYDA